MPYKNAVLVDIDGTVADISHRLKYLQQSPKDWNSFFGSVSEDKPILEMCYLVSKLERNFIIIFCTGRPDNLREETVTWLRNNIDLPIHFDLYMRKTGDRRPDYQVKKEFLDRIQKDYFIAFALEDRSQVVKMYRENGIRCLQVADGDY